MVIKLETPTERVEPSLMVFDRLADAREDWTVLRETADVSPYQNYDFVAAWFETIGRARALEPMIVVARRSDGRPLALFPLATREAAGLRVAEFLCGRESNFNIGLFHPGGGLDWRGLLLAAARGRPKPPDLLYLRNQPRGFGAFENPLLGRDACPSPSFAYGTALPADVDALDCQTSKAVTQETAQKGKAVDGAWRGRFRALRERRAGARDYRGLDRAKIGSARGQGRRRPLRSARDARFSRTRLPRRRAGSPCAPFVREGDRDLCGPRHGRAVFGSRQFLRHG